MVSEQRGSGAQWNPACPPPPTSLIGDHTTSIASCSSDEWIVSREELPARGAAARREAFSTERST